MNVKKTRLTFRDELQPLKNVNSLIIHHTAEDGWDIYKTHEFHQKERGWSGIGYNYFIEEDGTVLEGRGLHVGAHAKGHNSETIGICMSGNFDKYDPTPAQIQSLYALCRTFMKQFALSEKHILGHRELEGVTKSCPGTRFSMVQLRKGLSQK
ncbi:peptidoglycan recognition protein family protein [Bacillus cytotoxicus]|uniref:peptidoglycan recognition protein family protein n=1 Tax=Bacillus cytotoxicus TaxID=580165 RepID=UPI0008643CB1|nr:peptidoglycan recognition family protein [Bacillus cytotoxicus]AWC29202.1 N-acetylmuramoyl-L-alanine amidase [Bacillus cytotoxicus]AWC41327.1 N-acetylmuramoyl-L-alanine amidase [Bacillus cytotoxicus]AWC49258.1 N-acetylmuramoyl-L-alanine amidase [Bacillus cytotoxicus]AWC53273.1 N-acetylmuramoyl-L-alanine amidase [Bacillus cytotoxicus]AWC57401.1 N-acetylmuramoyl-L-alanine amidase [Bacillus cytotoxicus]